MDSIGAFGFYLHYVDVRKDVIMVMDRKYILTVFTPAYNRAHTIGRTYESLCRQTCNNFEWLVIDDGSSDNTRQLVEGWIAENKIPIRYIYQENQGMHGAHNTAYKNIDTELNTCIDSDDWMPDDAVEKIISFWKKFGSDRVAGIIGLDATADGQILGDRFPDSLKEITLRGFHEDLKGSGDKKLVYRTDVIRNTPEYPLLASNEVLVIVDYQDDGSSRGMWRQYWKNPKGFAFLRKYDMMQTHLWKRKLEDNIHYVSHSVRSRNFNFVQESPMRFLTCLSIIPGLMLFLINYYFVKSGKLYK